MIMPLFDYSGFSLLSCNKTDLQTIQNNALRLSLGLRLNDRIFLVDTHRVVNFTSLEQRPPRNTRAANRKIKFKTEKYENIKYRNSPYFKASKLWDTMPMDVTGIGTICKLIKDLKALYILFDDKYFVT